jgi:hypothetical protein
MEAVSVDADAVSHGNTEGFVLALGSARHADSLNDNVCY